MANRIRPFRQLPWNGGVNTAVDSGLIPSNDLTIAENVKFASNSARVKREGHEYWDSTSDIPAVSSATSSGSVRTIVFASTLTPASIQKLVPGELIAVTSSDAKYSETSVAVASLNGDTITYIATSGSHGSAASGTVTITRASPIALIKDYWRFTGSANAQTIVATTTQPLLFKYDSSARRTEILPNLTASAQTVTHRSSSSTTRSLQFNTTITGIAANDYVRVTSTSTSEAYYVDTVVQVASLSTTSAANDTLNYTAADSLTESSTATSTITVSKLTSVTPFTAAATKQWATVFNETLILSFSTIGNTPKKYNSNTDADYLDLGGTPPDFSISAVHLNRLWTNDKENPDRLHYSATGNAEKWEGADDSGYLEIRPGDGDPGGIQGIYVFKGRVFVGKRNKMYQVIGDSPENFQVLDVSSGLGAEAHAAGVAVDQEDFLYVSSRGVHSLSTTDAYSDFKGTYISAKIQPTFEDFIKARLPFTQATYVPTLSSVAFAVSEVSGTEADTLWFYSTDRKEWFSWPEVDAQAVATILYSNDPTLFYGTSDGRLVRTEIGTYTDFSTEGIRYRIKSGTIYPDNDPFTIKAFKYITLYFRPVGTYTATVKVKIDNYSTQAGAFSQSSSGDLLGSTFILGSSVLGATSQFAPYTMYIDGYGRGCTIEVEQTGTEQQLAIYGYEIGYEVAEMSQETLTGES